MTNITLHPYPPGADANPAATRWVEWFARYINSVDERKRRARRRRQFAAIDPRTLQDIGISQAQRFIAVNNPYAEL